MLRTLALLSSLLLVSGAAEAGKVVVDYDESYDFSKFRTYLWGQGEEAANAGLSQRRIEGSVGRELTAVGLTEAAPSDLTVVAYIAEAQVAQPRGGMSFGVGGGGVGVGASAPIGTKMTTTFVIRLTETESNKLVWEATTSGSFSGNADKLSSKIDKAVKKAFRKYPSRPR